MKYSAVTVTGMLGLICGGDASIPRQYPFAIGNFRGQVRVSSEWNEGGKVHRGNYLLDQNPKTSWVPDTSDSNPFIQIIFTRRVSLDGLVFELGWRENQSRYLMSLPSGDHYERILVKVDMNGDSLDFHPVSERMTSICQPEISIDGTFQKRMSRVDVLPYSIKADTLTIRTKNIVAGIHFLGKDSLSNWLSPKSILGLMQSSRRQKIPAFPVQDVCALKDTSFGCKVDLIGRKSFGVCSPFLASKNPWYNFKRILVGGGIPNASFRMYQNLGSREVWLNPVEWEWETVDAGVDGTTIRPLEDRYEQRPAIHRFSFPVLKLSEKGIIDTGYFLDNFESGKGPEWIRQHASERVSIFDTSEVTQDTVSIRIGNQVWMRKNLYQSSQNASGLCPGMELRDTGKWNRNCFEYGRLYPYRNIRALCPKNWHVPSPKEWTELFSNIRKDGASKWKFARSYMEGDSHPRGSGIRLISPLGWIDNPDGSWNAFGFDAKLMQIYPPPKEGGSMIRVFWGAEPFTKTPQFMSSGIALVETKQRNGCGIDVVPECFDIPAVQLGVEKSDSEIITDIELSQKSLKKNPHLEPGLYFPVRCIHD